MSDGPKIPNFDQLGLTLPKPEQKARNELGQDEFFQLMVAQLKHQDPNSPLDSKEFIGQVAQFSTVSGIQDIQKSFEQLASSLQSNQALQASTLVGRQVLIEGGIGQLSEGRDLAGAVNVPHSTSEVRVDILDASGQVVRQLNLGPSNQGLARFSWDGLRDDGQPATPGAYRIGANVAGPEGAVAANTLVAAHVDSVSLGTVGSAMKLNLSGQGSIEMDAVREIL